MGGGCSLLRELRLEVQYQKSRRSATVSCRGSRKLIPSVPKPGLEFSPMLPPPDVLGANIEDTEPLAAEAWKELDDRLGKAIRIPFQVGVGRGV
jgi:hypothetical protein